MPTLDRIERLCRQVVDGGADLDDRALRAAVLAQVLTAVPADAHVWLLTDPVTAVGASPLADVPSPAALPAVIRCKYLTAANRWTTLAGAAGPAPTLLDAADRDPAGTRAWRELLAGFGVADVVSTVFRDRHGCWGFLDLWRRGGPFTAAERDLVGGLGPIVTPALRRSLARTFAPGPPGLEPVPPPAGPVVLVLGDDLGLRTQTPAADAYLRALPPTGDGVAPVPAAALNVAAQLLAAEQGVDDQPPRARVHAQDGLWVTLQAARLAGEPLVAVSVVPTPPAERADLYARVLGLTGRESELLGLLVAEADTRELARRLFVSEHTVQDHLKSIFAKAGTGSRRELVARATGAAAGASPPG